jgi:hypothetical protein
VLLDIENPISLFKMVGISDGLSFVFVLRLDNHVLDSSEFDDVSRFYIKIVLLRGYPLKFPTLLNSLTTR